MKLGPINNVHVGTYAIYMSGTTQSRDINCKKETIQFLRCQSE